MNTKLLFALLCFLSLTISSYAQTKEAQKLDVLSVLDCEALRIRSFNLITEIEKTPGSRGYLIVYEGNYIKLDRYGNKTNEQILPMFGELDADIQVIEKMLKILDAPLNKIKIIKGGYRKEFVLEFWFVPKGEEKPEPTPTLKKMKYRKGKPPKFTYWDC